MRRRRDRSLFEAATHQLDNRRGGSAHGTLADATLLPAASIRHDPEAHWAGHRRRKPVHGHKAHVATDRDAALIRGVEVTTANIHNAAELGAILPDASRDTFGDSAHSGSKPQTAIRVRDGRPRVVHTGTWGGAEALARLQAPRKSLRDFAANAEGRRVRARIEKVSGTAKRSHGLCRMPWLGLARAGLRVRLTAMA